MPGRRAAGTGIATWPAAVRALLVYRAREEKGARVAKPGMLSARHADGPVRSRQDSAEEGDPGGEHLGSCAPVSCRVLPCRHAAAPDKWAEPPAAVASP